MLSSMICMPLNYVQNISMWLKQKRFIKISLELQVWIKRVKNILPYWSMISHAGKMGAGSHRHRGCVWFCHKISYGNLLQEIRLGSSYHTRYLLQKLISGISLQAYVEQTAFHRPIDVNWGWLPEESFMTVLCAYRTASYRTNQMTLKKKKKSELLSARLKYFKVYVTFRPPSLLMSVPRRLLGHSVICSFDLCAWFPLYRKEEMGSGSAERKIMRPVHAYILSCCGTGHSWEDFRSKAMSA